MSELKFVHKHDGNKTHLAAYSTSEGMIHVAYLGGYSTVSTQLGGMEHTPEALAKIMLGEAISKK